MPQLKALRPLNGKYGHIHPGGIFTCDDESAESLEARGLAYRYYPPMVPRPTALQYETKVITAEQPPMRVIPEPTAPINAPRRK